MSRLFRISIDQAVLAAHLAQERREQQSNSQLRADLIAAGFLPEGVCWVVREDNLGYLIPSEITEIEVISKD